MGVITEIKTQRRKCPARQIEPSSSLDTGMEGTGGQGTRLNSMANFTLQSPAPCQGAISFGTVIQNKIQKRETTLKPQTRQQPCWFQVYLVITLFRRKLVKRGNKTPCHPSPHSSTELSSI